MVWFHLECCKPRTKRFYGEQSKGKHEEGEEGQKELISQTSHRGWGLESVQYVRHAKYRKSTPTADTGWRRMTVVKTKWLCLMTKNGRPAKVGFHME